MRYWGRNVLIDGSIIMEQFVDPLAGMYLPGEGPPELVTNTTSNPRAANYEFATQEVIRQIAIVEKA